MATAASAPGNVALLSPATQAAAATPVSPSPHTPRSSGAAVAATVDRVTASFTKLLGTISLFEPDPLTPREFLTKFYTERNMHDKLKDIESLVAYYGNGKMNLLYAELDKRYGTNFVANPPCGRDEVRQTETVASVVTSPPPTTAATFKPAVNKVILLGNSGVGKTNLLSRLAKGEFSTDFASTIGVEFLTHCMEIDGTSVKAQIWDTAGQERFHAMMSTYYRKAVGALLVFDVTDKTTFDGVQKWLDQLLQVAEPGLTTVLVGNKADADPAKRAVSTVEAQAYATAHHMTYVETSAKTGANVDKAFRELLTTVHRLQSCATAKLSLDLNAKPTGPAPDSFCG
ncbi:Aste57867_24372 [Aphanomyces stellatus]|uniref:Aste57867_24372 protein n=1 Tax=Aphanomyces stellatus TaxID=120398 RepID=A0A485LS46_9STRA|nr:hypothetical protein As57867_024296 [Aphanomyces stellatus]VFU01012.1 Aste57867_24372 [Aphanomyces stellatus]